MNIFKEHNLFEIYGLELIELFLKPGIALPTTLASSHVATVTYPSPRPVAASALQHKQRVFTGTVTKLHENFGFVDEDVFFQTRFLQSHILYYSIL